MTLRETVARGMMDAAVKAGPGRPLYEPEADAAISAVFGWLSEPSEGMVNSALEFLPSDWSDHARLWTARKTFLAMLAAAREEAGRNG